MPESSLSEGLKAFNAEGRVVPAEVSKSQKWSVLPFDSLHAPNRFQTGSFGASAGGVATSAKHLKPFREEDIKILLLENVNQSGKDVLSKQGYQVESLRTSLPEDELIEKIKYDGGIL
jgi:D-3-phosphoglycerate dehydrogenase / 2-oxoglutarate reductase